MRDFAIGQTVRQQRQRQTWARHRAGLVVRGVGKRDRGEGWATCQVESSYDKDTTYGESARLSVSLKVFLLMWIGETEWKHKIVEPDNVCRS